MDPLPPPTAANANANAGGLDSVSAGSSRPASIASVSSSTVGTSGRVPISQRLSTVVKQAIETPTVTPTSTGPATATAVAVPEPDPASASVKTTAANEQEDVLASPTSLPAHLHDALPPLEDPDNITPELVNDLRVQLQQANLRESQLQRAVHALEEELVRAQSHAVAFENAMAEMTKLRERMEHMSTQLRHEEERNHEMEASRRAIDAEYESLSVSLFDQANNMVKEQSMLRAHAERRAFMAETRLRDAEGVVESLRIELAGLKRLLEEEAEVAYSDVAAPVTGGMDGGAPSVSDTGAPAAPVPVAPIVRPPNTAGEEWQSDALPITLVAPALATPEVPTAAVPASVMAGAAQLTVPASPQPSSSRRGSAALPVPPAITDTATPTLHPHLASEFHTFLTILFAPTGPRTNYLTPADRENSLYRTKFMERLFEEDVKPTLAFPALSWLQKKSLAGAVSSNALAIMPRRTPILVKRKPKSSGSGSATLRSAAKSLLPALQSLGSAGVVAGFAVPGGPLGPPPSGYSPMGSPTTGTTHLPDTPEAEADDGPLEYAPDTCECWGCGTPVVNLAPLTVVALSDTDTPRPVCKLCRGKLVAVCQLFAYLRRLAAGIVPKARLLGGHVRSGSSEAAAANARDDDADRSRHVSGDDAPPQPAQSAQDKYATAASALFQRFSTVTASLSSRYGAHSPTPPASASPTSAPAAAAAAGGAEADGTSAAPGTGRASPNPPAPVDLEPTVPLTPEFVGALWSDLCRLRQRMFLARLAIPLPGNADLFEGHEIVERAVQARDAAPDSAEVTVATEHGNSHQVSGRHPGVEADHGGKEETRERVNCKEGRATEGGDGTTRAKGPEPGPANAGVQQQAA